uniref:RNase H type-1 domain-containing protein n=1 Tax=Chenopodium quinoa TaxID=63459 RepID=A0A803N4W1_CHEQI
MEVLNKAINWVAEYGSANENKRFKGGSCSSPAHWVPPEKNMYKINCDAAVFNGSCIGIGGVVRDNVGYVLSTCLKMEGVFNVEVAEALGARHALQLAFHAGLRIVVLQTDCLKLFTHLSKRLLSVQFLV